MFSSLFQQRVRTKKGYYPLLQSYTNNNPRTQKDDDPRLQRRKQPPLLVFYFHYHFLTQSLSLYLSIYHTHTLKHIHALPFFDNLFVVYYHLSFAQSYPFLSNWGRVDFTKNFFQFWSKMKLLLTGSSWWMVKKFNNTCIFYLKIIHETYASKNKWNII